jgi:hypothetical protein
MTWYKGKGSTCIAFPKPIRWYVTSPEAIQLRPTRFWFYAEYPLSLTNSEAREFASSQNVLIYYLFNDAVNSAGYVASNNSMMNELVNNEFLQNVKGDRSSLIWVPSGELRTTTKYLMQDVRSPRKYLKAGPPDHEVGLWPTASHNIIT